MTRVLRGLTWDHPRGYEPPGVATRAAFADRARLACRSTWDRRSLKQFGDQPIDALARTGTT